MRCLRCGFENPDGMNFCGKCPAPISYDSPFGGYKMSGFGRDLGMQAMDLYTQVKSVFVDLNM